MNQVARAPSRYAVQVDNVSHAYLGQGSAGTGRVLEEIEMSVGHGEFVSIVGPSGCGKSTLLSVIAGLQTPIEGQTLVFGEKVTDIRSDVGFIFQRDALLPWRTALDNVALGPQYRGQRKEEARSSARRWLSRVGLDGFGSYYPRQLSGGMRKRVQLAATMVCEPAVVLMDEPFSALDAQTRSLMEDDLLQIWSDAKEPITVIFVTHDLDEAIALADRVVVMTAGPGRVKANYAVPLARPRDVPELRNDEEFTALRRTVWDELREEVQTAGRFGEGRRSPEGAR